MATICAARTQTPPAAQVRACRIGRCSTLSRQNRRPLSTRYIKLRQHSQGFHWIPQLESKRVLGIDHTRTHGTPIAAASSKNEIPVQSIAENSAEKSTTGLGQNNTDYTRADNKALDQPALVDSFGCAQLLPEAMQIEQAPTLDPICDNSILQMMDRTADAENKSSLESAVVTSQEESQMEDWMFPDELKTEPYVGEYESALSSGESSRGLEMEQAEQLSLGRRSGSDTASPSSPWDFFDLKDKDRDQGHPLSLQVYQPVHSVLAAQGPSSRHTAAGNGCQDQSGSHQAEGSGKRAEQSTKHPSKAESSGRRSDPDDCPIPVTTDQGLPVSNPANRGLACPFYKRDGRKYHACGKYQFKRVRDVKQHIHRRHKKPDLYCPRCYKTFSTSEGRDAHARDSQCQKLPDPNYDGVSQKQSKQISHYANRSKTAAEQWYDTWDILFPNHPRPQSPYLDSMLETTMPLMRSLWRDRSSQILSNVLTDRHPTLDPGLVDSIMGSIFDQLEAGTFSNARDSHVDNAVSKRPLRKLEKASSPSPTSGVEIISEDPNHSYCSTSEPENSQWLYWMNTSHVNDFATDFFSGSASNEFDLSVDLDSYYFLGEPMDTLGGSNGHPSEDTIAGPEALSM